MTANIQTLKQFYDADTQTRELTRSLRGLDPVKPLFYAICSSRNGYPEWIKLGYLSDSEADRILRKLNASSMLRCFESDGDYLDEVFETAFS